MNRIWDAIVIGGGQAGLAAGYHLQLDTIVISRIYWKWVLKPNTCWRCKYLYTLECIM
ncbi:hypothetical protein [Cytobacillus sp.]|uniref:hypothetical protein n=1 Tax=Cytobacillus sp. TaxID=2675269 RepID=UPI0028BED042|nr:hypothetical protein [Cytobacillus sp.]